MLIVVIWSHCFGPCQIVYPRGQPLSSRGVEQARVQSSLWPLSLMSLPTFALLPAQSTVLFSVNNSKTSPKLKKKKSYQQNYIWHIHEADGVHCTVKLILYSSVSQSLQTDQSFVNCLVNMILPQQGFKMFASDNL